MILFQILLFLAQSQAADSPPQAPPELLFVIDRSTNANEVRYVAQLTKTGTLDPVQPVSAYWIMSAEDGHREELTWYEQEHLYGFTVRREGAANSLVLITKAMENLPIHVSVTGGLARAETEIAGHTAYLKRVFVQVSGGLFPGVDFIRLSGEDSATGYALEEIRHP